MADRRVLGSGNPYFVVSRLFGVAVREWSRFNGEHLGRGVDVLKLHPSDFLDVIWFWLIENQDEKGVEKLGRQIWLPPMGEEPTDDNPYYGYEAEMAALADFEKRKRGGKGVVG